MKALLFIQPGKNNKAKKWTVSADLDRLVKVIRQSESSFTERFIEDNFIEYIELYKLQRNNFFEIEFSYDDLMDEVIAHYLNKALY